MDTLTRKENWPSLLHNFVIEYEKKEFCWGKIDCCMMMFDWIEYCTGTNLSTPYKGKYSTKIGAIRLMKKLHNGGVLHSVSDYFKKLNIKEIPSLMAQRGDVVIVNELQSEGNYDDVVGICIGLHVIVLSDSNGLHKLPLSTIKKSWKV
jgi:hypothetical protein